MKQKNGVRKGQISNLHAWLLSFVYGLLAIFAVAATVRLPFYVAVHDYGRLAGLVLFWVVVLAGLADNLHTHLILWQQAYKTTNQAQTMHIAPKS